MRPETVYNAKVIEFVPYWDGVLWKGYSSPEGPIHIIETSLVLWPYACDAN